jgi:hypothetical protein
MLGMSVRAAAKGADGGRRLDWAAVGGVIEGPTAVALAEERARFEESHLSMFSKEGRGGADQTGDDRAIRVEDGEEDGSMSSEKFDFVVAAEPTRGGEEGDSFEGRIHSDLVEEGLFRREGTVFVADDWDPVDKDVGSTLLRGETTVRERVEEYLAHSLYSFESGRPREGEDEIVGVRASPFASKKGDSVSVSGGTLAETKLEVPGDDAGVAPRRFSKLDRGGADNHKIRGGGGRGRFLRLW